MDFVDKIKENKKYNVLYNYLFYKGKLSNEFIIIYNLLLLLPLQKYDIIDNQMVARSYYDSIDLLVGSEALIGTNGAPDLSVDIRYANDLGSTNIKKSKKNFSTIY